MVLFVFPVVLFACTGSGADKDKAVAKLPPQYYYYPKANVYFDSANKEYLFVSGDSANWQMAKQIPAVVLALMDKHVAIQGPADPVWKDNENHKLVYSALLYATANDTMARKPIPKPVKQKTAVDSSKLVKKERKGIRRFLDKIFGGGPKKEKSKKGKDAGVQ